MISDTSAKALSIAGADVRRTSAGRDRGPLDVELGPGVGLRKIPEAPQTGFAIVIFNEQDVQREILELFVSPPRSALVAFL